MGLNWGIAAWIGLNAITAIATARTSYSVGEWERRNRDTLAALPARERGSALALMLARNAASARSFGQLYRAICGLAVVLVIAAVAYGASDPDPLVPGYVVGAMAFHTVIWARAAMFEQHDRRKLAAIADQAQRERKGQG